jgi:hypothetical protein
MVRNLLETGSGQTATGPPQQSDRLSPPEMENAAHAPRSSILICFSWRGMRAENRFPLFLIAFCLSGMRAENRFPLFLIAFCLSGMRAENRFPLFLIPLRGRRRCPEAGLNRR